MTKYEILSFINGFLTATSILLLIWTYYRLKKQWR